MFSHVMTYIRGLVKKKYLRGTSNEYPQHRFFMENWRSKSSVFVKGSVSELGSLLFQHHLIVH